MNRDDLTKRLIARLNREEAVVAGIGFTNFALWGAGNRPQNFYMLGSMGLAIPIALGVAIAQPQRRVFALEGDGSLMMELGNLATIGARKPENLVVVVWDNEAYQITGGQQTTSGRGTDVVAVAKGCGITDSAWAKDEADFEALVDRALSGKGPSLIACKIDSQRPAKTTPRDPVQIRERFMRGIGVRQEPA
jgi:thiamine pyrophosphate-dependent acetolactate synthase large subunit-like protein